jgi:large subunit ribosomal protein L6
MSRIGKKPVPIPEGVSVEVGQEVLVRGPKGELKYAPPPGIRVWVEDGALRVGREGETRNLRALHGLARSVLANMVEGVSRGFEKTLEIVGVGYRATLRSEGELELSLGFSHPVVVRAPEGVSFEVPGPNRVVVRGADKQLVGQVAAEIRRLRPPEPYKGKGVRYLGEQVRRKAGKAGR